MATKVTKDEHHCEPFWSLFLPTIVTVTGPTILGGIFHQLGPYWVQMDISGQLLTIGIFFNQYRLKSPLKEMSRPTVFDVEVGRVGPIDMVKDLREVASGGLYKKVIVIIHQTVNMDHGSIAMMSRFKVRDKFFSIPWVSEDGFSLISAGGHMVKGIWELDPQGSGQVDLSKTLFPFFITRFDLCQELRPDPYFLTNFICTV